MKKRRFLLVVFVLVFIFMSIGYAVFSSSIDVKATAMVNGTFDVEFSSATVISEVGSANSTITISEDKNIVTINVPKLEYPGSYVDFKINVKNSGTIPAVLKDIERQIEGNNGEVDIIFTGLEDLKNIQMNQGDEKTFNLRILWVENSGVPSNISFSIKLRYEQITV